MKDIYRQAVAHILQIPEVQVSAQQRALAKKLAFTAMYSGKHPARTPAELFAQVVEAITPGINTLKASNTMKCFLLLTKQSEEHSAEGVFALVAIDTQKANEIFMRRELFQMAKAKDGKLKEMSFQDNHCYFYNQVAGEEIEAFLGGEKVMESFLDTGKQQVTELLAPSDDNVTRTDMDRIVIEDDGFYWRAKNHYNDDCFETRLVFFEEILPV